MAWNYCGPRFCVTRPPSQEGEHLRSQGDPVDTALIKAAQRCRLEYGAGTLKNPQVRRDPLQLRTQDDDNDPYRTTTSLLIPRELLAPCCLIALLSRWVLQLSPRRSALSGYPPDHVTQLQSQGIYVLGMAQQGDCQGGEALEQAKTMTFLGLLALIDPPG